MKQQFTAGLLAGGKSSRMGRDKAGVEFSGLPMWRHQLLTLQEAGADEILISGRKDACYGAGGTPIIEDAIKNVGPLSGVAALLSAAAHPLVLILAIDIPYMTSVYIERLRHECSEGQGAVPEKAGFFEALAAFFPKKAETLANEALRGEDHSMQNFVRQCAARNLVKIIKVSGAEEPLFRSLNTPADLANLPS